MRRPFDDELLASLRERGDPEADAVVADFVAVTGETDPRYLVQQLIEHRRSLPPEQQVPSVRAYFANDAALPSWADPELLRRGQDFFRRYGVHIASALFCASLPKSYAAVDGAQVLLRTAELVSHTRRRLAQTGEMLLDVMGANDPAGSAPFAADTPSYRAPHGVRLFHAAVRHLLHNDPGYDVAARGVPINQEDLLGTLSVFTVVVIESLERFGVPLDAEQRDAYTRLWLATGHLLGIEPDLLCSRRAPGGEEALHYEELVSIRDAIERRHVGPSRAGRTLMSALLAEESEALPLLLRGLPRACTRSLVGDEYCDHLGVPAAGWTPRVLLRPLPVVNRLLFGSVYYELSGWLFAKLTRNLYRAWIGATTNADPHPWRYESVVGPWKLEPARTRARRVARHPVRNYRLRRTLGTAFASAPH